MKRQESRVADQLSLEHSQLEKSFVDLAERAASGESRECEAVWSDFAQKLENHMLFEDRDILPRYEKQGAAAAAVTALLRQDHATIRQKLSEMGVDLQLHLVRAELINSLLSTLRQHALRERETLYPWLANHHPAAK